MNRDFYLDLAASGLRMPIGTDLVLHEQSDWQKVLEDGQRLGQVVVEAARRYKTPLALAHMDLEVEKLALLSFLGVPAPDAAKFHFEACPEPETLQTLRAALRGPLPSRLRAQVEAVSFTAGQDDLVPVAMCIGPFSLVTKLLADPITPVFLAGAGATAEDEPDVRRLEAVLDLAWAMVQGSVAAKLRAGAKAVCIAEPAANKVFFSPKQLAKGSDIFARYAMKNLLALRRLLEEAGADLIFHCCGELNDSMLKDFAGLDPAVLSLGSSRRLWEDAALVSKRTVLFGNLPSKKFYSDELISRGEVERLARELQEKMRSAGHPFILGSECDVLSVPGCEAALKAKVDAFLNN